MLYGLASFPVVDQDTSLTVITDGRVRKNFSSFPSAILYACFCNAVPLNDAKINTHHVRRLWNGAQLQIFHPQTNYKTFGEGLDIPSSLFESGIEEKTVSFVASQLNLNSEKNGILFVNAVANVVFKNGKAVAFGQSFVDTGKIAGSEPSVNVANVIPKVETALQGKVNEIGLSLEYLVLQDGSVALVHVLQVQNPEAFTFYEAYVDAHTGVLLSVTDFVAHASYHVIPIYKQVITEGLETLTNPHLISASPNGWHDSDSNDTAGNNVISYQGSESSTTSQSSAGLNFLYIHDSTLSPTEGENLDAARTNAFYLMNAFHDTLYQYGFTERAFNFQNDNFDKGGRGGDRVRMSVQDPLNITNNAGGQPGFCRMFLWDHTMPERDGAMENDIPVHEMTHGLTSRMTGGGTASCLQTLEASGLGEGWSDAVADWFAHSDSPDVKDFVLGTWVLNNTEGIRTRPYSTSTTINSYRYSDIASMIAAHDIGEVWANNLHNVYAQLVTEHGFSSTARTSAEDSEGNIVFLQLLVDALALQPCNPTFPDAREGWIQADVNRYDGANKCLLWKVFASKGLGVGASDSVDSGEVLSGC
ncbi:hypothetical protein L218DRAFT_975325 [Marasmius fiardii PR-910]|nr:hypothetical protein L218DRAFT_975325 [Marasmius fiardii PR-910]